MTDGPAGAPATRGPGGRSGGRPRFSIVTAVYNVAPYLEDFIRSIDGQGVAAADLEVIAVDDGSTDGSLERLRQWSGESRFKVEVHSQPNAARGPPGTWGSTTPPANGSTSPIRRHPGSRVPARRRSVRGQPSRDPGHGGKPSSSTRRSGASPTTHHRRSLPRRQSGVDLVAEPNVFPAARPSASTGATDRELALRYDPRIRPNFEEGHFAAHYLLSLEAPRVGLLRATRTTSTDAGPPAPRRCSEARPPGPVHGRAAARLPRGPRHGPGAPRARPGVAPARRDLRALLVPLRRREDHLGHRAANGAAAALPRALRGDRAAPRPESWQVIAPVRSVSSGPTSCRTGTGPATGTCHSSFGGSSTARWASGGWPTGSPARGQRSASRSTASRCRSPSARSACTATTAGRSCRSGSPGSRRVVSVTSTGSRARRDRLGEPSRLTARRSPADRTATGCGAASCGPVCAAFAVIEATGVRRNADERQPAGTSPECRESGRRSSRRVSRRLGRMTASQRRRQRERLFEHTAGDPAGITPGFTGAPTASTYDGFTPP